MPSGYTRPASNRQPAGLLDVMNATKPSFWGLLGQNVQGVGMGLLDALMAPGNAAAGQYDAYYDPSSGQTTYGRNGNPYAMMGDASNLAGMVTLGAGAVPRPVGTLDMGIKAYHGTPHSFDKFDISKIGTGEGAQAYGHGLYFAESPGVARSYRDALSKAPQIALNGAEVKPAGVPGAKGDALAAITTHGSVDAAISSLRSASSGGAFAKRYSAAADWLEQNRNSLDVKKTEGNLYEVDINAEPHDFLDWDKPLIEQPKHIQDAVLKAAQSVLDKRAPGATPGGMLNTSRPIGDFANMLQDPAFSKELHSLGVKGIKYLDAGSRGAGDGSRNYVVFHHDPVKITGKLST